MTLNRVFVFLLFGFSFSHCTQATKEQVSESSDLVTIQKISPNVYVHTSYLQTESFGNVPCNGMIVANDGEAIVFDTPADEASSLQLITILRDSLGLSVKAVVPTHFHADCVGGLKVFKEEKIPSYAYEQTIEILKNKNYPVLPDHSFSDSLTMHAGKLPVYIGFFGAGHTADNVVGYVPEDSVLFGGCLIKELNAGKGNLEDANERAWPVTVRKVIDRFPDVVKVVPGHGQTGSKELLSFTLNLFKEAR